jgi:hypothetical protein
MRLLVMVLVGLVVGCVDVGRQQLADGTWRLRFDHSLGEPQSSASSALHITAGDLCPAGYRKLDENARGGYVTGSTEWTIRCD